MLLVETTGSFQLLETHTKNYVRSAGYTVVPRTEALEVWIAERKLRLVAELGDGATDKEWLEYVASSDGELELAKASFLSAFGIPQASEVSKKRK